jgi:hypothetical protein
LEHQTHQRLHAQSHMFTRCTCVCHLPHASSRTPSVYVMPLENRDTREGKCRVSSASEALALFAMLLTCITIVAVSWTRIWSLKQQQLLNFCVFLLIATSAPTKCVIGSICRTKRNLEEHQNWICMVLKAQMISADQWKTYPANDGQETDWGSLEKTGCRTIAQGDCENPFGSAPHAFWPQVSMMEQMMTEMPRAKFVLITRQSAPWLTSVKHWGVNGSNSMWDRLVKMDLPNLPSGHPVDDMEMVRWHDWHYENVRKIAKKTGTQLFEMSEWLWSIWRVHYGGGSGCYR